MAHGRHPLAQTLLWLGFAIALVGYILPWVSHSSAALSLNATDLAAWSARHIREFEEAPALLTAFLLRGQLVVLAAIWPATAGALITARRGYIWLVSLLFVIALLPPLDGLLKEPANPNYRQLLLLSAGAALAPLAYIRWPGRYSAYWPAGWAALGLGSSALALSRSAALYGYFQIDWSPGAGAPLLWSAYALIALALALDWRRRRVQSAGGSMCSVT